MEPDALGREVVEAVEVVGVDCLGGREGKGIVAGVDIDIVVVEGRLGIGAGVSEEELGSASSVGHSRRWPKEGPALERVGKRCGGDVSREVGDDSWSSVYRNYVGSDRNCGGFG